MRPVCQRVGLRTDRPRSGGPREGFGSRRGLVAAHSLTAMGVTYTTAACADAGVSRAREEPAGVHVAATMTCRLLLAVLLCAACHAPQHPTSAEQQANGEDVQIQVVRLEHTGATDVAQALDEAIVDRFASGRSLKVAVQPTQNALVLSGTTDQIRNALELVARLDARPAR